jgi:ABC-type spermidine/putrescine transport system permease subunit I
MGPTAWTVESYLKFLTDPFYLQAGWRTFKLGFTVTLVSLAIGYPLAYASARMPVRFKNIWMFILLTPLLVSVVVRTFGWLGKLPLSADHAMMDSSVATREESPCANRASRRVRSSPS